MKFLNNLNAAFTSGLIGAIALVICLVLIFGQPTDLKFTLYRLMIWGGIWGILLVLPIFTKHWFLRGSLIGITVILFNFIVLMPLSNQGFFASHASASMFFGNIILNYIWGIVAGAWYFMSYTRCFNKNT